MKGKTLKILLSYFENEEILCRACKIQNNLYNLNFSAEFRHSQEKRTGNFKTKMCRFYPIFIKVHYRGRLGFLDDISNNFYVLYLYTSTIHHIFLVVSSWECTIAILVI